MHSAELSLSFENLFGGNFMLKIDPADFSRADPVPEDAVESVVRLMKSGDMFRYSSKAESSEALLLEQDFARYIGVKYALGVNSCSSAILLALLACGVKPGDKVLMPAFTFTAVPGSIINLGAEIVPVECNNNYRVDIEDFRTKSRISGAKVFLLSYMRGHTSDLDQIQVICKEYGITIIEDAAHALGNRWRGQLLGKFGEAGCFSFQHNKIINAGEGGMITTDNPDVIAKVIYLSGAYELLPQKHLLSSEAKKCLDMHQDKLALYNMRATNIMGAIVRPQLKTINDKADLYRAHYNYLLDRLSESEIIEIPKTDPRETRVPDSIQFRLKDFSNEQMEIFTKHVKGMGLPMAAFGVDPNNARAFWNWGYANAFPELPMTRLSLAQTCDMRLPYSLGEKHLDYISDAIFAAIDAARKQAICA